jgi:hypothetical protein
MRRALAVVGTAVLLVFVVAGAGIALGTSYNPLIVDESPVAAVLAPGTTIFLFHGGSEETRRSICMGEVLAALRPRLDGRWEAVGTVRVEAAGGAFCFRAEVIEGELRPHDVVPAGAGALLVITSGAPCMLEDRR